MSPYVFSHILIVEGFPIYGGEYMTSIVKDLIEYIGISDNIPDDSSVFKQINVEKTHCLPPVKPDIEQIVKVISKLVIKSTKVIKTPSGISLEGQKLTGFKVVIEGELKQKIQYVADIPTQTVHAAHFNIPFSTYIVLPADFVLGTPVTVNGYIEDVYAHQMGKKCIYINTTILFTADFC